VGIRRQIQSRIRLRTNRSGSVSIQLLVIMVPILFGFMGFAIDLGRLYLIRGELTQAANAMALAAAAQLNGTSSALDAASAAAALTLDNGFSNGVRDDGNPYNFAHVFLNSGTSFLTSNAPAPSFYTTSGDALASPGVASGSADGTTAQYAQANITADAPLIFWALMPGGQSRKTTIAATAVAGVSAPLCTACGVDIFAIAAADQTDTLNWGFTTQTHYTFGYTCTGAPATVLSGDSSVIPYILINRYDTTSALSELNQLFNDGAGGLAPSADPTQGCMMINAGTDVIWATATTQGCRATTANSSVEAMLCGLTTRLDPNAASSTYVAACGEVGDIATLSGNFSVDTDVAAYDDYTQYTGNNRRILNVAVVDALSTSGTMNILGFRQFLLEPTSGLTSNNPTDGDGRFSVLYIDNINASANPNGTYVPIKQGRFDGGCGVASGPGKVILFQ